MKKLFYFSILLSFVASACSKTNEQAEQFVKDFYHHLYYKDISQAEYNQFVRKNMTKKCYSEYIEVAGDYDYILQAQDFELFDPDDERSESSNWKTCQENGFIRLTDFEQMGLDVLIKVVKQDGQYKIDKIRSYYFWKEFGDDYLK